MLFASAVMVAALLSSCKQDFYVEEQEVVDSSSEGDVSTLSFSVDAFDPEEGTAETRSTYDSSGYFYFAAEDTVGVFPSNGSQVFFEITGESVGKKTVQFDGGGWAFKANCSYWSYYPLVGDFYLKKDHIPVEYIDLTQDGNESLNHISPNDFIYTDQCTSQNGSLSFYYHRLNCILRPRVTLPAGTYSKIVIQAESDVFVSKGYYDLSADAPSIIGTDFTDHLTLYLKNASFTEETAFVANLMTAPVDISNMPIKVIIYSGDTPVYYYTYERSTALSANIPYGLRCSDLRVYGDDGSPAYTKATTITVGGTYLIVDANDGKLFKGGTDGSFISVSPKNNVIIDTDEILADHEFTVENAGNGYFLKFNDGRYLVCNYNNSTSSGLAYVATQSDVKYPYVLTTGENGAFFFSTTQVNDASKRDQVLYFKTESGANIFKIGGSGTSIGVHLYLKHGKLDRGLDFDPKSVVCALGDTPVKPTLSGIFTTATYSSSDERIARVDASGNVTPVTNGTVTITAAVDEDDQYCAATASYTLLIRKEASTDWVDMGSFNLENQALTAYLNDASTSYSNTNDDTETVMDKYSGSAYSSIDRKDCPAPVHISWTNSATRSTSITIYEDQNLTKQVWTQSATERATSADVYNLIPGRTYYYTVSENSSIWEKGYFSTTGRRRMIKVSDVEAKGRANNCRDLGGLEVTDKGAKKTIKYGILFRGSCMDRLSDTEKSIIVDYLNVGMDVDLRNGKANSSGQNDDGNSVCYQPFSSSYGVGYISPGFNSFTDLTTDAKVKSVITSIFNTVKTGKSTYLHCHVGADRTGYFAMLIEGLLGVSEKDCSIDYELTSFSDAVGQRFRTGMPKDYYFRQGIAFLRGRQGDTFQNKIENYLVNTIKIRQEDIDEFKSLVLE